MKYVAFSLLAAGLLFASCENDPFTEKPVSEFNVQQESIPNHTPIRMVAWSGGGINSDDGKKQPGYQYVVENANTGKRFRILSKEAFDESFFVSGDLQYVSYTSKDTSDFLVLLAIQHSGGSGAVTNSHISSGADLKNLPQPKIELPETIWSNEEYRAFEQKSYPTVFGTIVQVEQNAEE